MLMCVFEYTCIYTHNIKIMFDTQDKPNHRYFKYILLRVIVITLKYSSIYKICTTVIIGNKIVKLNNLK